MDRGVKVGLPHCVTSGPTCRPVQGAPRFSSYDSWDRLDGRADHGSISPPASRNYLRRLHLRNHLSPEREMFFHATPELLYSIVTSRWRQSLSKTSALRPLTFSLHNTEKSPLKTPECTAAEQLLIICGFHKKWKHRFLSFPSLNIHFMAHKLCKELMTEVPLKSEPPLRLFTSPLCRFYPQLTFMRSLYSENLPNLHFSLMF